MAEDPTEERLAELQEELRAAAETIEALKRAAQSRLAVPGGERLAVQKAMANLQNSLADRNRALEESEARYRALFDHNPDMGFTVGQRGRITDANQTSTRHLARPREQLVDKPLVSLFAPESHSVLDELLDSDEGGRGDLVLSDGRLVDVAVARVPGYSGAQVLMRDVTEERALEDQLRQSHKMDAIGQLAGGVAHDFNNLLCGIVGFAELLKTVGDEGQREEYVEEILSASGRAAELVSRLLAFARRGRMVSVPTDLHALVDNVVAIVERTIDRRVVIEKQLEAENAMTLGDPSLLESALLNLALNARDAMPEGGLLRFRSRVVRIDGEQTALESGLPAAGDYLELGVEDTGTGMDPEVQEKAFEPFFTTKPVGQGTGLGLSAVYGTVKSHRGLVRVTSEAGRGSTFRLLLPALPRTALRSAQPTELRQVGSGKILLVDDEKTVRESARRLLEQLGHRVLLAADGPEALELFNAEHGAIDAVILDLVMPQMHGTEVLRRMRAIAPAVPILISSGYNLSGTRASREMGADGFLQKPFTLAELSSAVAELLAPGS